VSDSPLFSRSRLALEHRTSPVVVVGLPRSGSSYLSHVMSCIDDWFVFDDLYLHREARALGVAGRLDAKQLEGLIFFLGWQLRARLRFDRDFVRLRCELDDVDEMDRALRETFTGEHVEWHELLEEWLVRLALLHGCRHWGYKAPQDFMHMPLLARIWPDIRFVLLVRDPRANMASAKYVEGEDGDRGQYHPLVHARYWQMAQRLTRRNAEELGVPLHHVRYEDLVRDPDGVGAELATFLDSRLSGSVPAMGANTSFRAGERKTLTPTETWLCEQINGPLMERAGYKREGASPRLRDVPDLLWTSARFAAYQTARMVRDPAARASVGSFVRNALGARSGSG
jgi:hypothetical protein